VRVGLLLLLVLLGWYLVRVNGTKQTNDAIRAVVRAPIVLHDSVENVPAASWKAVALDLPYPGTVDVSLQVVNGNPVDVVMTTPDQIEVLKQNGWNQMRVFTDFNAMKTRTYRRTGQLGQGSYYLLIRDTSLGILSQRASDISVKAQLNP
jgi:predicted RNA binding protein YcfA (HicA-like mRNA interferase family)